MLLFANLNDSESYNPSREKIAVFPPFALILQHNGKSRHKNIHRNPPQFANFVIFSISACFMKLPGQTSPL